MAAPILDYTLTDDIAVLTMDDGRANALGHAMIDALTEALSRADKEAKAVVILGREGRFCAGFDLEAMAGGADKVVEVQALSGDSSDNIPGLPGIGEKTAKMLIDEYGDVETLLANLDQLSERGSANGVQLQKHVFEAGIAV